MTKLRVLSLFAGIGGFDLGLERTGGFETVAFCEIEPFAVRVLNKNWPEVSVYGDVRELTGEGLRAAGIIPDVICGGFPCQDISFAGKGAGLAGERSGLWFEFARLIGEIRPQFVIVENVAALLSRGLGDVLGTLASLGYDAEWHCIPACAVGAPHRRDRIWILAHPNGGLHAGELGTGENRPAPAGSESRDAGEGKAPHGQRVRAEPGASREDVADAERRRLQGGDEQRARTPTVIPAAYRRHRRGGEFGQAWRTEPDVGRVAHGVPHSMERLRGLGNAVVPQIPELIGRAILASLAEQKEAA
jgi:DNA (cytosine-5)-methyltransferase 1